MISGAAISCVPISGSEEVIFVFHQAGEFVGLVGIRPYFDSNVGFRCYIDGHSGLTQYNDGVAGS